MNGETKIKTGANYFDRVSLRSWFEERDGVLVGMGSAITYDRHGNMISHKVEPTGIRMVWEKPAKKKSIPEAMVR